MVSRWDCMMGSTVRETATGEFVTYEDYATLESENAKLKGEYEWVASINTALDESNQSAWAENAKLRAGQESLLLNLAEQKRQADEYRMMWARAAERAVAEAALAAPSAPKADDPVKVQLLEALEYFVSRKAAILAKFDVHGPADIAAGMRIKFGQAEDAISAARQEDGK